ncbi:unnamed protein product [Cladocopium goreaui]|uniref:Uncharacterized protein n=1 Tax=Cladocopium goreaui TaxID=2562237 RepID=A0A9P1BTM0_9DINO|nr:unnamed protein product [Cladocopium goreaui]CAI4017855.1 unnamed protein product [Cladocopium goreaui]
MGNLKGGNDPSSAAQLAYFHGTQSKIRILENVQTGEIGSLTEAVHEEDWHVRKILTVPSDTGFKCCSRKRQWHLAVHKDWGQFVEEPADMYAQLVESLTCLQVDISQAFWMTDPKELLTEKKLVKKRCKKDDSFHDTLTKWEQQNLMKYEELYIKKYGHKEHRQSKKEEVSEEAACEQDFDRIIGITNAFARLEREHVGSPSGESSRPMRRRWLAAAEKAALLGFPILQSTCNSYGCQRLQWEELSNPHGALGNSMHVPNAAAVILSTLLSVQLCRTQISIS